MCLERLFKIAEKLVFSVLYSDKATDMSPPPWGRVRVGAANVKNRNLNS